MTDDDLTHMIWTVWPLLDRFEAAPYSLSKAELEILTTHECQKPYRLKIVVNQMAEDELGDKLSGLMEEIKTVMERRKERIEDLRNEISAIEDQNAALEKTISELLSGF